MLVEIAWLLPGKHARNFRREGVYVFCRALGGDLSLVEEIKARHGMMEGTLEQEALLEGTGVSMAEANGQALVPVNSELEKLRIRQIEMALAKDAMDLQKDAMELQERELKLQKDRLDQTLSMSNILKASSSVQDDERIKMALLDASKNTILLGIQGITGGSTPLLLTNGEDSGSQPISISTVAAELKMKLTNADLITVGRSVAKRYRNRYNQEPPVHHGVANGHTVPIKTYFSKDKDLIVDALHDWEKKYRRARQEETEEIVRVDASVEMSAMPRSCPLCFYMQIQKQTMSNSCQRQMGIKCNTAESSSESEDTEETSLSANKSCSSKSKSNKCAGSLTSKGASS